MKTKDSRVPPLDPSPELLRVRDVAQVLSLSVRATWRLIATGELQRVRVGGSTRVSRESVDLLKERGAVK